MKPPFQEGTITSFDPKGPYFFLSNFYSFSIEYEGITYPSTEHAYQAAKSLDTDTRMLIMRQPTANAAKKMGGSIILRTDWPTVKFQIMKDILKLKFGPNSILAGKLRFTGDVELVEGNWWHDRVWGVCNCPRHNWTGENHLGQILMEIRNELGRNAEPATQGGVQIS